MATKPTLEQKRSIYCVMHGHSKIISMCFGYVSCARCETQIGDTLGGCFDTSDAVVVDHDCAICRKNLKNLKPKDTTLVPPAILKKVGFKKAART